MSRFVYDSYAILAVTRQEASASRVEQLLENRGHEHWMSAINVGEVYYRSAREFDVPTARLVLEWIDRTSLRLQNPTLHICLSAAIIKSRYAISYADCFAAALARQLRAAVVTGDEEFRQLERNGVVQIEWLPPKPKRTRR